MKAKRITRPPRGFILVFTLLVATAVLFFGFSYVELYRAQAQIARMGENELIAAAAAGAGIDEAIYQLKRNAAWKAGFAAVLLPHSGAAYSMSFVPNQPINLSLSILSPQQTVIPYSTNNSLGALAITGYGGRIVPPSMVDLISVGTYGRSQHIKEALINAAGGIIVVRSRW